MADIKMWKFIAVNREMMEEALKASNIWTTVWHIGQCYVGQRKQPTYITEDYLGDFFSDYVDGVSTIRSKVAIATSDFEIMVTLSLMRSELSSPAATKTSLLTWRGAIPTAFLVVSLVTWQSCV